MGVEQHLHLALQPAQRPGLRGVRHPDIDVAAHNPVERGGSQAAKNLATCQPAVGLQPLQCYAVFFKIRLKNSHQLARGGLVQLQCAGVGQRYMVGSHIPVAGCDECTGLVCVICMGLDMVQAVPGRPGQAAVGHRGPVASTGQGALMRRAQAVFISGIGRGGLQAQQQLLNMGQCQPAHCSMACGSAAGSKGNQQVGRIGHRPHCPGCHN